MPTTASKRRLYLKGLLAFALMPAHMLCHAGAQAAQWFAQAFEAKTTAEVLSALQVSSIPEQEDIQLEAPQKAENGAVVQVEFAVPAHAGAIPDLSLLADANPTPLVARFQLGKRVLPHVVTRIKMAQSGDLIVLAHHASGKQTARHRPVIVLEDGCASNEREEPFTSSMKMRARMLDNHQVELKIIILHPMRTGRSKGDDGQLMPAHFMQQMQVMLNDTPIITAQTGTAIARNPYFTFYLTDAQIGDQVSVHWQDNRGFSGQGNVQVTA